MKKLSFQIAAAKLKRYTLLKYKQCNDTCWSSTYERNLRFLELVPFIEKLHNEETVDFLPSYDEQAEVKFLCIPLAEMNSVMNELQRASLTLSEARVIFDAVVRKHGSTSKRLGGNVTIVENTIFKSSICKIHNGDEEQLTSQESDWFRV